MRWLNTIDIITKENGTIEWSLLSHKRVGAVYCLNTLIVLSHVGVALKWYKKLMRNSRLLLPIVLGGSG